MREAFPNGSHDPKNCLYLRDLCLSFYFPDSWNFWNAFQTWSDLEITGYFPVPKSCKMQVSSYK